MEHDLLALAETIRLEIPALMGAAAVPLLDELDRLVDQLRLGWPVGDQLFELLTSAEPLRSRLDQLLGLEDDNTKSQPTEYSEMPGHGEPVAATVFACPKGDYRYPLLEIGEFVPLCPHHHLSLIAE